MLFYTIQKEYLVINTSTAHICTATFCKISLLHLNYGISHISLFNSITLLQLSAHLFLLFSKKILVTMGPILQSLFQGHFMPSHGKKNHQSSVTSSLILMLQCFCPPCHSRSEHGWTAYRGVRKLLNCLDQESQTSSPLDPFILLSLIFAEYKLSF